MASMLRSGTGLRALGTTHQTLQQSPPLADQPANLVCGSPCAP